MSTFTGELMQPAQCPRCGAAVPETGDTSCPACASAPTPAGLSAAETAPPSADAVAKAAEAEAVRIWHADLRRLTPLAPVTPVLVGANVLVFAAMAASGARPLDPSLGVLVEWGANFGPVTTAGGWWRLLTAAFLHGGLAHLAFNMLFLVGVGLLTERMVGSTGFLLTYLSSAVVGSLASIVASPAAVGVGASGAVFGVFGAFFSATYRARGTIPELAYRASRKNMATLLAVNLVCGFMLPNIDAAAHVGGLAWGLGCGLLLGRPLREEGRSGRAARNMLVLVFAVPVVGLGMAVAQSRVANADDPASEIARVAGDEERLLAVYNDAHGRAESGALDADGFRAILRNDVIEPWKELRRRFDRVGAARGVDPWFRERFGRYLETRGQAFEQLDLWLRTQKADAAARSRELMALADQIAEEISRGPNTRR